MSEHQDILVGVGRNGRKQISLKRVALGQRALQRAAAGYVFTMVALVAVPRVAIGLPQAAMLGLVYGLIGLLFIMAIAVVLMTVRLMIALGRNAVLASFLAIGMLIPLVGVLLVASVDGRASRLLRQRGVKVGLLGVPVDELHKLIRGACPKCGYDIRGLTAAVCPECGAAQFYQAGQVHTPAA